MENLLRLSVSEWKKSLRDQIYFSKPNKTSQKNIEIVRRLASQHESGHALVAWMSQPFADLTSVFVKKKLEQDGQPAAMCQFPTYNRTDKIYLKTRIVVMVAGPVAVHLVSRVGNLGSESDTLEAMGIAQQMVVDFGHCDALGNRKFPGYTNGACHPTTMKQIDVETRKLLMEAIQTTQKIIIKHQAKWIKVVEALLDDESLNFKDMKKISTKSLLLMF